MIKKTLIILLITFSFGSIYAQTPKIKEVYSANKKRSIDTIDWKLNDITINFVIETEYIILQEDELRFSIINEKNITFFKDSIVNDYIYGRLKITKNLLPGIKVLKIESINKGDLELTKPFLIHSTKKPKIIKDIRQKININDYSNVNLLIVNSQNLSKLKIYDSKNKKYVSDNDFLIKIIERDIENKKVLFELYCSSSLYLQNNDYKFHIITNNIPNDTFPTPKRVRDLFKRGNLIKRFDEISVYKGNVSDLIIKNKLDFDINIDDNLVLTGLNNQPITLTYNNKKLIAKNVKFESLSLSECIIEKNGNDDEYFRMKINLLTEPEIFDNISWKELNNIKPLHNKPYVDPKINKTFLLEFFGKGINSKFIENIEITGDSNNISLSNFEIVKGKSNFYSVKVTIPKTTKKGKYVIKHKLINGNKKQIFSFDILERNTPNVKLKNISIIVKNDKSNPISYSFVGTNKIEDWDGNHTWPKLVIKEDKSSGTQNINIELVLFDSEKNVIAKYVQKDIIINEKLKEFSKKFKFSDFISLDPKKKYLQLEGWFSFQIKISYNKDYYYDFPTTESIQICDKEIVYAGERVIEQYKLSIPFAQTVFILGDSLQAAPYNLGFNSFYKYRNKDNWQEIEKAYWGFGLYFTQNDLLKEQALQIGAVVFGGYTLAENFNIALGIGLNFNVKFKKDANDFPFIRIPLVLNIGYDF